MNFFQKKSREVQNDIRSAKSIESRQELNKYYHQQIFTMVSYFLR